MKSFFIRKGRSGRVKRWRRRGKGGKERGGIDVSRRKRKTRARAVPSKNRRRNKTGVGRRGTPRRHMTEALATAWPRQAECKVAAFVQFLRQAVDLELSSSSTTVSRTVPAPGKVAIRIPPEKQSSGGILIMASKFWKMMPSSRTMQSFLKRAVRLKANIESSHLLRSFDLRHLLLCERDD